MIALSPQLDDVQQRAVSHALDEGAVTISGAAGSGKTVALLRRALRAAALAGDGDGNTVLLASVAQYATPHLAEAVRKGGAPANLRCATLSDVAYALLEESRFATGRSPDVSPIDDARSTEIFAQAGARLFALEWDEFTRTEFDPEISGLRIPERFAATAFRLIRKLRMAGIDPDTFEQTTLRAGAKFYGRPPNFADPDLTLATQPQYRDSLRVQRRELEHQYAREVDLAKILSRLYHEYLDDIVAAGCMTPLDATVEATRVLAMGRVAPHLLPRYVFVDDAQDMTPAEFAFVKALRGDSLRGVTFAGDLRQRTRSFSGPRSDEPLRAAAPAATFALAECYRGTPTIVTAAESIATRERKPAGDPRDESLALARFDSQRDEAEAVAATIERLLADGTPPGDIAVILRTLHCAEGYVAALLRRNVPVGLEGEGSLYAWRPVEDALAALWSVADPYRHDWLLRNLEAPWLALSDATLALLCGEAADAQPLLFELPEEPDDEPRRWDRRREIRLGRNVLRGDRDGELPPEALERIQAFRAARDRWVAAERTHELPERIRLVLTESVLNAAPAQSAQARFTGYLVAQLIASADRFCASHPRATLLDFLQDAQRLAQGDEDLLRIDAPDPDAVAVLDVESAKGREFAHVFVLDVRSGAFPRYYVPDAFLFTRNLGMIAKENVGEAATTARTAKFSYAMHSLGFRDKYNAEERRALALAMRRARAKLWVSAWGRATRGIAAPELLEELLERG